MSSAAHGGILAGLHAYGGLFVRQPVLSAVVLLMTFLSMLTDGLGVLMLVPLLATVTGDGADAAISRKILGLWEMHGLQPTLSGILGVFLLLIALRAVVRVGKDWVSVHLRTALTDALRNEAHAALMQAEWRWLSGHRRTDQISVLFAEVQRVGTGIQAALSLLATGAAILAYLIVAFGLEPFVTAIVTGIGGLLAAVFSGQRRKAVRLGIEQINVNRSLLENAFESIGAIKLAKILGTQDLHAESFDRAGGALRRNQIRFTLLSGMSRELFQFAGAVLVAGCIVLGVGVWQIPLSQLLVLALIFSRLAPMLTSSQQFLHVLLNALPALSECRELIREARAASEPQLAGIAPCFSVLGEVTLEAVTVHFPAQERPALQDIDLRLPAGSITVITGPSGAGKSTLADVLMGLLVPDRGQMLVDGTPLTGAARIGWRRSVSYVPQEVGLYNGTIRDNLRRARPGASEAELEAALDAASAGFVRALAAGLDTRIGDGGQGLSGGERQRLALARGLLRSPALLVLDEVTSALDPENEARIRDSISALSGRITIVILGHRTAFLAIADQVVHLQEGRILAAEALK